MGQTIYFCTGEKGGVGKSLFCKTAAQYLLDHKHSFTIFDCDRSNADVLRSYKSTAPCRVAIFSENPAKEDAANGVYNAAMKQDVLCNLPAQIFIPLRDWIAHNELLAIAPEDGIRFKFLYVSDGGFDSLSLFQKTVETFGNAVSYTFIKNLGRCDDWLAFEEEKTLQSLIASHKIPVLEMPKLMGSAERNRMDQLSLTFAQAREHKKFSSISRQRVKRFLREAYTAFETAGVFAA